MNWEDEDCKAPDVACGETVGALVGGVGVRGAACEFSCGGVFSPIGLPSGAEIEAADEEDDMELEVEEETEDAIEEDLLLPPLPSLKEDFFSNGGMTKGLAR